MLVKLSDCGNYFHKYTNVYDKIDKIPNYKNDKSIQEYISLTRLFLKDIENVHSKIRNAGFPILPLYFVDDDKGGYLVEKKGNGKEVREHFKELHQYHDMIKQKRREMLENIKESTGIQLYDIHEGNTLFDTKTKEIEIFDFEQNSQSKPLFIKMRQLESEIYKRTKTYKSPSKSIT